MSRIVALGTQPLSLEHGVLVFFLWVGDSIGLASKLVHACWIIKMDPAEQLLCHLESNMASIGYISHAV